MAHKIILNRSNGTNIDLNMRSDVPDLIIYKGSYFVFDRYGYDVNYYYEVLLVMDLTPKDEECAKDASSS